MIRTARILLEAALALAYAHILEQRIRRAQRFNYYFTSVAAMPFAVEPGRRFWMEDASDGR